jgi:uncharacterized protein YoxC
MQVQPPETNTLSKLESHLNNISGLQANTRELIQEVGLLVQSDIQPPSEDMQRVFQRVQLITHELRDIEQILGKLHLPVK